MSNIKIFIYALAFAVTFTTIFYFTIGRQTAKYISSLIPKKTQQSNRGGPSDCVKERDLVHADDSADADELYRSTRVLCFVPTSPRNLATKATAVKETWLSRCNAHLFFSSETDKHFPTIGLPHAGEGLNSLTAKSMAAFQYIYQHHYDEADWFLKADDDTYIIVENLRYLLSHYDPSKPLYLGHHFEKFANQGYMSGGAGYVISKEALRRLATADSDTCRTKGGAEDAAVGRCLEAVGVEIAPSLDVLRRQTFHPLNLASHLFGNYPQWLQEYTKYPLRQGGECCSELSISFHYIDAVTMHVMDHLLYRTSVYGRRQKPHKYDIFKRKDS